jgi:hypothetical protein
MASAGVLIFVFAGVSCGRARLILAEFAPVPNVQSVEAPAATRNSNDVRPAVQVPTLPVPDAKDAAEIGGPAGPEPTRFGDWERNGRCVDF